MNDDDKVTDAVYVNPQDIDPEEDQNGQPLDPIEENQTEEILSEEDAKKELRDGIIGNDDNAQDSALDEENR